MLVRQWVEFSQEVDIQIGREEVLAALTESPDAGETWFPVLNRFALCLNALPDATIATWTQTQRKGIADFLAKHAARFHDHEAPHG
jgi:hypothetical protein